MIHVIQLSICLVLILPSVVGASEQVQAGHPMSRMNFMSSECHPNRKLKPYVHKPVASNDCYACHKPIGSDHNFGKVALAAKHCTECHKTFSQAQPGPQERKTHTCVTCHNPHESDHPKFLKVEKPILYTSELCLSCHEKMIQKKGVGHHPVTRDLKLVAQKKTRLAETTPSDCFTCHDVHRSKKQFLLKREVNQLCVDCHEEKVDEKRNHVVKKDGKQHEQGCLNCHRLHEGMLNSRLLKESKTKSHMCIECHSNKAELVSSKHDMKTWPHKLQQKIFKIRKMSDAKIPCQICHAMHNSDFQKNHLRELTSVFSLDPISNQCLSCHHNDTFKGMIAQVQYFSHPNKILSVSLAKRGYRPDDFSLHFFSMLGEEIKDNRQTVTLSCGSCHNPHIWSSENKTVLEKQKPGTIQNSFLINNKKTMVLCASCHGQSAILYYSKFHTRKIRKLDVN